MYDATLAETVTIRGDGGDEIEAYLARPMSQGPYGGVVVIHHMPGYDAPTKEITRRFAAEGYNALMPNLYHREAPGASADDAAAAARAQGGVPDVRLITRSTPLRSSAVASGLPGPMRGLGQRPSSVYRGTVTGWPREMMAGLDASRVSVISPGAGLRGRRI
jgi:dienelactone hydrolase family protein